MPKSILNGMVLMVALVWGCGQDYNSNSGDERFGKTGTQLDCSSEASARFCASVAILKQQCFSCHSDWAQYTNDAGFVRAGLVVPKDTKGSKVISRLINAGSDMPRGGSALPATDYEALQNWVNQMADGAGK